MPEYFVPIKAQSHKVPCITLVGMPGVGKSTIGQALAKELHWAFVDSDYVIESLYGVPLQQVTDAMTKDDFLELEGSVICSLRLFRTVIATGGSVVYKDAAMRHLQTMGPVVYLRAEMSIILERIAKNPQRGIAIAPDQTIEDLFEERAALYTKHCNCTLDISEMSPEECSKAILHILRTQSLI